MLFKLKVDSGRWKVFSLYLMTDFVGILRWGYPILYIVSLIFRVWRHWGEKGFSCKRSQMADGDHDQNTCQQAEHPVYNGRGKVKEHQRCKKSAHEVNDLLVFIGLGKLVIADVAQNQDQNATISFRHQHLKQQNEKNDPRQRGDGTMLDPRERFTVVNLCQRHNNNADPQRLLKAKSHPDKHGQGKAQCHFQNKSLILFPAEPGLLLQAALPCRVKSLYFPKDRSDNRGDSSAS